MDDNVNTTPQTAWSASLAKCPTSILRRPVSMDFRRLRYDPMNGDKFNNPIALNQLPIACTHRQDGNNVLTTGPPPGDLTV